MTTRFTLIELVVVLCILSVVLALSAPQLGRFYRNRRLVEATRQLLIVHNAARDLAAYTGLDCRLTLSADWRTVQVSRVLSRTATKTELEPIDGRLGRYALPPGVSLVRLVRNQQELAPGAELIWEVAPWGGRDELQFDLSDSDGEHLMVEIAAGSGAARVTP